MTRISKNGQNIPAQHSYRHAELLLQRQRKQETQLQNLLARRTTAATAISPVKTLDQSNRNNSLTPEKDQSSTDQHANAANQPESRPHARQSEAQDNDSDTEKRIQQKQLSLQIQIDEQLKLLTKHYPHNTYKDGDSRFFTKFGSSQLQELVTSFAKLNKLPQHDKGQKPYYGVSEAAFKELLVQALIVATRPHHEFIDYKRQTAREVQSRSKTLVRNLLHTALISAPGDEYTVDPKIKALYIAAFHSACEEFVNRHRPLSASSTLSLNADRPR